MSTATATLVERFGEATGHPTDSLTEVTVLRCLECSCLFDPDDDGENFYPDRYEFARDDGSHCDEQGESGCSCHNLPRAIEPGRLRRVIEAWTSSYALAGPGPSSDELAADALRLCGFDPPQPEVVEFYGSMIAELGEDAVDLDTIARRVVDSITDRCPFVNWNIGCVLQAGHDGDHDPGPEGSTRSLP